jgi:hypothetical protein
MTRSADPSRKNVRPSHLLDAEVAEAWCVQADNYPPRL